MYILYFKQQNLNNGKNLGKHKLIMRSHAYKAVFITPEQRANSRSLLLVGNKGVGGLAQGRTRFKNESRQAAPTGKSQLKVGVQQRSPLLVIINQRHITC